MRPASIRRFDMFYLASLALLAIGFFISFDATVASVAAQTAAKGLEVGTGFTVGLFAVVLAIELLLWFLVSRKGVAIAKWVLVLLVILDIFGLPALIAGTLSAPKMISLLRFVLEAAAVAFLFRADAKAWFAGTPTDEPGDPAQDV
jgi:hypothetical protein